MAERRYPSKHERLWLKTRRLWLAQNPPNHQGYYTCWICGAWVPEKEMELDHIKSRSRYPHLRYVLTNLAPSCGPCNEEKGSGEAPVKQQDEIDFSTGDIDDIWGSY